MVKGVSEERKIFLNLDDFKGRIQFLWSARDTFYIEPLTHEIKGS